MALRFERFQVRGLHGKFDIDIPIRDNRLILVGVNGLGKTTVVNVIYFFLTEQWRKLLEFEFSEIEALIDGKNILINRGEAQLRSENVLVRQREIEWFASRSAMPSAIVQQIFAHPAFRALRESLSPPVSERLVGEISRDIGIPSVYVQRMLGDLRKSGPDLFSTQPRMDSDISYAPILQRDQRQQVIYLPTYRRIEQDLKAIFPELEDKQLRDLTSRAEPRGASTTRSYVELVHFGMQDVEKKIKEELDNIRERTRFQLSSLTASYLQDIIRSRADQFSADRIASMDQKTVKEVLSRVEEPTLSNEDKAEVEASIQRIRIGTAPMEIRDRYLGYFFSRLLEIYTNLSDSEKRVRRLVEICNNYFQRKTLVYNDNKYTAQVVDENDLPINWRYLSSGEKQVASLFTHLILGERVGQLVIIDEPELSLSVPWQKTLLPDISGAENCDLLIAVTHSPFIYRNSLESYAIDLARCIKPSPKGSLA